MIRAAGRAVAAFVFGWLFLGMGAISRHPPARAEVSYQGKTLSIIINSTADITARMVGEKGALAPAIVDKILDANARRLYGLG